MVHFHTLAISDLLHSKKKYFQTQLKTVVNDNCTRIILKVRSKLNLQTDTAIKKVIYNDTERLNICLYKDLY